MLGSLSRRNVLHGAGMVSLAGLSAATLAGAPALADSAPAGARPGFGPGPRSGLPWNSGASQTDYRNVAAARGRLCDTMTMYNDQTSFATIAAIGAGWKNQPSRPERISLGMSPIPKDHDYKTTPGIWALTAAGTFDYYYQGFAATLAASGRTDLIVRIGWEANHINRAWYCGADRDNYILTFQRIVTILRAAVPTVTIEWCCMKKGAQKDSITNYYPGNDYVDLIGVNYYDVWPAHIDQAAWDKQFMMQYPSIKKGLPPPVQGPWGLGQWLAFAVANGKKLAISEWAIWVGGTNGASVDNPFFITKMFEFFTNNQANIAYENYFNQKSIHQVVPGDVNPLASAEYLRLWGRPSV